MIKMFRNQKNHPNQTLGGNFVDRKVWGNFCNGGSIFFLGIQGLYANFFLLGGGHATHHEKNETGNLQHTNFFLTPCCKKNPNFSVHKISPKSLAWMFFLFLRSISRCCHLSRCHRVLNKVGYMTGRVDYFCQHLRGLPVTYPTLAFKMLLLLLLLLYIFTMSL